MQTADPLKATFDDVNVAAIDPSIAKVIKIIVSFSCVTNCRRAETEHIAILFLVFVALLLLI